MPVFDREGIKASFGRAAKDYDAHAELQREVRGRAMRLAADYWPADARILDAGCGTGALAASHIGWDVTGCDIALLMCVLAKQRGAAVNADAMQLPFADGVFDGVFSSLMLQWASDPAAMLRELGRVLAHGSVAIIATLVEGTLAELRESFAQVDTRPHVSHFPTPHALLSHASDAGFTLLSATQDTLVEYYPDTVALMRSLQAIGATNQHAARARGLMTPRKAATLERAYAPLRKPKGLPASWQVLTLALRKI